jgi:hypothetical protein
MKAITMNIICIGFAVAYLILDTPAGATHCFIAASFVISAICLKGE